MGWATWPRRCCRWFASGALVAAALVGCATVAGCATRAGKFFALPAYQVARPTSRLKVTYRVEAPPAGCTLSPPILFLPALAMDGAMWREVGARLGACRARIYLDPAGEGDSPALSRMTGEDVLLAIRDVIDDEAGGRAVLAGSSLGGVEAIRLAAKWPERVESLILADPAAAPFALNRWQVLALHPALWAPFFRLIGPQAVMQFGLPIYAGVQHDDEDAALMARDVADSARRDTLMRYYRAFLGPQQLADTRDSLRGVRAPVILFWGDHDRVVSPDHVKVIVDGLSHTTVELHMLPGGHLPPLSQPEAMAREIDRFLQPSPFQPPVPSRIEVPNALKQGQVIIGPKQQWFPLLGLNAMFPLNGRTDVALLAGVARGSIDRHYPLETGRVVMTVGAALHDDPMTASSWSFGYLRTTARLELVWRWVGGISLDGTLFVDPSPDRVYRWGGLGSVGYVPSVIPWLRAFVGWGQLPGDSPRTLLGVELDTPLTRLLY